MSTTYTELLQKKYLPLFIREKTKKNHPPRPKTVEAFRLCMEKICHNLDQGIPLTVNYLRECVTTIEEKYSQSYVNQTINAIDTYLVFLAGDDLIDRTFIEMWELFAGKHRRPASKATLARRNYIEQKELEAIFYQISRCTPNIHQCNRDTAFYGTVLLAATRLGDLCRATLENVTHLPASLKQDSDSNEILIPAHFKIHLTKFQTKDWEPRDLIVFEGENIHNVEVYHYLEDYLSWRNSVRNAGPTGPVFTAIQNPGNFITERNLFKIFAKNASNAGLKLRPHMLRGTFAEINGDELSSRSMRQILGHSAQKTTDGYTDQPNPERLLIERFRASKNISNYR